MKNYPTYCNNGDSWVSSYPDTWERIRLKYISNILLSNVDKKIIEGEKEIQMCNYTHVYYNEIIDREIEFDEGTCTEKEYDKFVLRSGDVIVTKDSETQDDNGVPSYVPHDLPGVVCGYHLSIIRPNKKVLNGQFLYWLITSRQFKNQFEVLSKGVTRFGLSKHNIGNLFIPLPSLDKQERIVERLNELSSQVHRFKNVLEQSLSTVDELHEHYLSDILREVL